MNKAFGLVMLVLITIFLFCVWTASSKADVLSDPDHYTQVTVKIVGDGGMGSGFIYSDNKVMTAHHVVGNQPFVNITFYDGRTERGEVIAVDPQFDIAVIKVDTKLIRPATVGCEPLKLGQPIDVFGYPLDLGLVYSHGIVSSVDTAKNPRTGYQVAIDATVTHGNSGGPVFDADGNVVGIVDQMAQAENGPSINFMMPMNDINPNCKARE